MAPRILVGNIRMSIAFAIVLTVLVKIAHAGDCSHFINSEAGDISSPNYPGLYPSYQDCSWKFETTPGKRIKLIFRYFVLEPRDSCDYDYVALYDGDSTSGILLGKFCGTKLPHPVISNTNRMLLIFHSDASKEYRGFVAYHYAGCDVIKVNASEGSVISPNYPGLYPHNQMCVWEFETIPLRRIKLNFDSFQTEKQENCNCDYVELYDGDIKNNISLGRFCGHEIPPSITSSDNKLVMLFRSDVSYSFKGFRATYKTELIQIVSYKTQENFTQYFLSTRHDHKSAINKWGTDVTRSAVALFLNDPQFFAAGNETGENIAYELTLQLMAKLVMKKRIDSTDLALFVNALTVACINPKHFYGVNIVAELRQRVDNSNHTSPFLYLALCNGREQMKMEDVRKLQELFHARSRPSWRGTQAMAVMALKCMSRQGNMTLDATLTDMASKLVTEQKNNGLVHDNVKITALVTQALIATESYGNFDVTRAIKAIVKHTERRRDIEEMYYIFPISKGKTLLDINSNHCADTFETDLKDVKNISEQTGEQTRVQVSIIIGDNEDFSRTWKIKVPSNHSFYHVLEIISVSEPDYKMQYTVLEDKPYVDGVANFQDSIDYGSFWFIYSKALSSTDDPVLVEKSPLDIEVDGSEEFILWYRTTP